MPSFKPWIFASRRFDTEAEAVETMEKLIAKNRMLNEEFPHLGPYPTNLSVAKLTITDSD